ncbi:hypothetical protein F5Y15DRAFT_400328 [Xylariaceae sp. FL0016]|nr:hypothetical protein F5Y15DRAFT_400328 [Xylariaceae sp. FL0016]
MTNPWLASVFYFASSLEIPPTEIHVPTEDVPSDALPGDTLVTTITTSAPVSIPSWPTITSVLSSIPVSTSSILSSISASTVLTLSSMPADTTTSTSATSPLAAPSDLGNGAMSHSSSWGLSHGVIAGIVISVVAGVIIIAVLSWLVLHYRWKARDHRQNADDQNDTGFEDDPSFASGCMSPGPDGNDVMGGYTLDRGVQNHGVRYELSAGTEKLGLPSRPPVELSAQSDRAVRRDN